MAADSGGRTVLGDSNGEEVIFRPQRPGYSVSCQQPARCSYRDRPRDCGAAGGARLSESPGRRG